MAGMVREQFSRPEESTREKRRKETLQLQFTLLSGFVGALIGSSNIEPLWLGLAAAIFIVFPLLTNRYWRCIYQRLG